MLDDLVLEVEVRLDTNHEHLVEGGAHLHEGGFSRRGMDDDLRDHRIILGRDPVAGIESGIDADAVAGRQMQVFHDTRARHEVLRRDFRVDAALDGMSTRLHILLREAQRFARRDTDLFDDEIGAGHHLRHAMLHLDSRVHLHKVEVPLRVHDELDGACIGILYGLRREDRTAVHLGTGFVIDSRGWRLLDQLLVISLDGAVTVAEGDDMTEVIRHDLDLDVARLLDIALDIHGVIAEGVCGLALCETELKLEFILGCRDTHALAAATGGGLDDHRVPDLAGELLSGLRVVDRLACARNDRHAGIHHRLPGMGLVAHAVDDVGLRTDKGDAIFLTAAYELTVLRQEAIARMDRIGAGVDGCRDELVHIQIVVLRRTFSDTDPLIRELRMQTVLVLLRVDRDTLDAHVPAGPDDADRDFASIGN